MVQESNWDKHYKKSFRIIASIFGVKGNFVLNSTIADYILKYSKKYNKFLEIGAGSGRLTNILSKKFRSCTVLDKSAYAIKLTKKICKDCKFIHDDVFNYKKRTYYDAVASVGLVEHFNQKKMEKLILKHVSFASNNGSIFICVPSYSKARETLVKTPQMRRKYGYQDPRAEFKISKLLDIMGIPYKRLYLDRIGSLGILSKLLRYLNIITYGIFKYNIDKHIKLTEGSYALFIINKSVVSERGSF